MSWWAGWGDAMVRPYPRICYLGRYLFRRPGKEKALRSPVSACFYWLPELDSNQ